MALYKTDLGVAERYLRLVEPELRERFWPRIAREHDQVVGRLLEITGATALLDDAPALQRRLSHRNPWIDPLSHLQVELLARARAGRADAREPLLATITGIAAGHAQHGLTRRRRSMLRVPDPPVVSFDRWSDPDGDGAYRRGHGSPPPNSRRPPTGELLLPARCSRSTSACAAARGRSARSSARSRRGADAVSAACSRACDEPRAARQRQLRQVAARARVGVPSAAAAAGPWTPRPCPTSRCSGS